MEKEDSFHEEDGILLYCQKAQGFIFSPPPLNSKVSTVSLHSIESLSRVNYPGFSNIHYASFKVQPSTCSKTLSKRGDAKSSKKLVYGRKVWLLHVASKWYLSFKSSADKHQPEVANLVETTDEASTFRILPSDPTKSTGQTINIEDIVRLEIVVIGKRPQVLCAPNVLNIKGYDLKKASDGSDFILYSQSSGDKLLPPLALKGGEVVMFLNEKRDAYLTVLKTTRGTPVTGEGQSVDSQDTATVKKEVFAKVNDGTQRSVFTGGDSFWQIEHSTVQYNGNWVVLKESSRWSIRIRHLPSKLYLFLVEDEENGEENGAYKLILQDLKPDDENKEAVFQFIEDQTEPNQGVLKRRYVIIKHVESGMFISLDGKSGEVMNGHRCFKMIGLDSSMTDVSVQRDQKFWIEEVDSETLKKFTTLSGAFIILRDYMQKLKESDAVIALPSGILDALAEWSGKGSTGFQEKWPDMLRVMEGVELVLEFLGKETTQITENFQRNLCVVLKNYIDYASDESQLYLISQDKLLDMILPKMGLGIGAESVFSALVQCRSFGTEQKEKVLQHKQFNTEYILETILQKHKDFTFLQCLSSLCLSGGRPERIVQCNLLEKIIIPAFENRIFFRIEVVGDTIEVECPQMLKNSPEEKLNDFLIMQIELYAAVCKGVNLKSIDIMVNSKKILTYEKAVKCSEFEHFSPRVQSVFFSYLVSTLVDKNAEESGTDLENIWYIYAWKRFIDDETDFDPVVLSAIANTHDIISDKEEMVAMQEKIQDSLKETLLADIADGREELFTQRLSVLETLVAYGFYWRDDDQVPSPATVIEALIGILSRGDDDGESAMGATRKEVVFKLRAKAIEVLKLFLHQTYHLGTARLMFDYRFFREQNTVSRENQGTYIIPKDGLKELMREDFQLEKCPAIFGQHSHLQQAWIKSKVDEATNRLEWILYQDPAHSSSLHFPGQTNKYDYKLLNIYDEGSKHLQERLVQFLSYGDDLLRLSAAKLIFDLFKGECFVFDRSEKALIVLESYSSSWETYTTMVKYATFIDKINEEHIRALLRLLQGKGGEETFKPSVEGFLKDTIITAGVVPGVTGFQPLDETYTSKGGQDIVLTTGVVGVLLDYVIKFSVSLDSDQEELITLVCKALIRVTRGNKDVKEVVFARFDDLLQAKKGVFTIAHLLTEVLTDNIDACRKLPFSTVRQIFRMAAINDTDNREYHEYIPTLEAWMKVSKSSPQLLMIHQRYVATLFLQFFVDYYDSGWNSETSPVAKVKEADDKFLLLIHMMAVCAEGINKYCEDVSRDRLKFKSLMNIMVDQTIPLEHRLPFVMIMNEAFLKTERESLVSVFEFAQYKSVWEHVEFMTELIEKVRVKLKSMNKKVLDCQKIKIRVLSSQHVTHMYWRKHQVQKVNLKATFKEESVSLEDHTYFLGILYQYLLEGLVPVLSVFAEEYSKLWQLYKGDLAQPPLSKEDSGILHEFGKKLQLLVTDCSAVFVSTNDQKRFWENSLKTILLSDGESEQEYNFAITLSEYAITKDSEQVEEESVNKEFQVYLRNFKKLVYPDLKDNPQSLYPRGPGFQKLLKLIFPFEEFNDKNKETKKEKEKEKKNIKNIAALVELLEIIQKQLQQTSDSKEKSSLDELLISVLQVMSAVLQRIKDREGVLCKWQEAYIGQKVHEKCLFHLDNVNEEVVLQVLALLRFITLEPDKDARCQHAMYELISTRDSVFCHRVHGLLQDAIDTFSETTAETKDTDSQLQEHTTETEPQPNDGIGDIGENMELLPTPTIPEPEGTDETDHKSDESDAYLTGTLEESSLDNSIRTASIVLDCISALCDGQHRQTQKYLHDQEQSLRKLDIVKKIAILLQVLTEEFEKNVRICKGQVKNVSSYLDLIEKAIQALIETSAGNFENQQAVFRCQITDTINYLLKELANDATITISETEENAQAIKDKRQHLSSKAIELLQVLLEETDDGSQSLIVNFTEDVDLDAIIGAMLKWEDIGAYHILRLVADTQDIVVDQLVKQKKKEWKERKEYAELKLWDDFKARSRAIEVLYQPKGSEKKILTKVYFDFDPLDEADEDSKETVTNAITEESQEESLTEFNEWARSIRTNARYKYDLITPYWIWLYRLVYETSAPRHLLLVLLTVLLNLFTLSVFVIPENRTNNSTVPNFVLYPSVPMWYFPYLLSILGAVHILLSVLMVFEYIVVEKPNFTKKFFFVTVIQNIRKSFKRWVSQQECFKGICPNDWRLRQNKRKKDHGDDDDDDEEDYYYDEDDDEGYFKVDIFGFQSIYRFLFLFCSIAAIPLRGYLYSLCLFYVFLKVDVVQYILTALHRSVKQLLFVALIGAAVLLVFAMGAFVFLHDYFQANTDTTLFCNNLWQCFLSVTREGLLDTIGPAIPLTVFEKGSTFTNYGLRALFYDLPFFIIVTTIGLNIVTAVLIDRFSDLREERDQVESKKMKACFVCGLESEKFERYGKGFRNHVKEDHNKWNYVYYLIYLDRKRPNDRTALEKQIAEDNPMNKKYGKTDHFPINRAKVLPKEFQENEQDDKCCCCQKGQDEG